MEFSITYTIDDYRECVRAVRKPVRSKRSLEPLWVGVGTAFLAIALVVITAMTQKVTPTGEIESTKTSTFAFSLLPCTVVLGAFWAIVIPRMDSINRRAFRPSLLMIYAAAAIGAAIGARHASATIPAPANNDRPIQDAVVSMLPLVIMFIGVWIAMLRYVRSTDRNAWNGQPLLHLLHTIRLSDDKLETESEKARHSYRWDAFMHFRETRNLFVLRTSKLQFVIIPKRACRDGAELEALRELIERKVPNADPGRAGFAIIPTPRN
jgi:YcxB-like protein